MEDYTKEQDDEEFWEMIYSEYGEDDNKIEFNNQEIIQILCPIPGIVILFTEEIRNYGQEPYL